MILALAGGVGGAKLVKGLADVLSSEELLIVVNTGDDFEHLGLHISPDVDTVTYTLAGLNDPVRGWGVVNETWRFMDALQRLGGETWFRLGDSDLALHVERTRRLRTGETLSGVTSSLAAQLGVHHRIVPMSDDAVRTIVHTGEGPLAFQEYFVRRRSEPVVTRVEFAGAGQARMAEALHAASAGDAIAGVVICPSNPYLSIAPILAVPGVRALLERRRVPAVAVSPLIAGRALKGPAAKIMRELGKTPSSIEVARFYRGLIDALIIDRADASLATEIEALDMSALVTNTVMHGPREQAELARHAVGFVRSAAMRH